jgi:hypothetical protein
MTLLDAIAGTPATEAAIAQASHMLKRYCQADNRPQYMKGVFLYGLI